MKLGNSFERPQSIYELNTRIWLEELSTALPRPAHLADIPDAQLDRFAALGIDLIWLLGVWKTGAAGQRVSASNTAWRPAYEETLGPALRADDITGSPFAIQEYVVHADFGGNDSLHELRDRLHRRGIGLILDFVPNHTALDHPWVNEHPEFYIHGREEDLSREPSNYIRLDTGWGTRVLAYGRDPYFPGWPDTLQLNYRHPGLQYAMRQQLNRVAGMCDGLRCDMAMLLLPGIFAATWEEHALPADEVIATAESFWVDTIAGVRRDYPDFLFIAEAYWDTEWELQQQGFDFTYDKRLYDRLVRRDAEAIRAHLRGASPEFQRKLVRFLENHDEPRAADIFPPDIHRAAAVLTFLTPGLRLFHDGEWEGRKVRSSIHLSRRAPEAIDPAIEQFYLHLLPVLSRPELRHGEWHFLECVPAPDDAPSSQSCIAFAWVGQPGVLLLVAVNYGPRPGTFSIGLPFTDLARKSISLELPAWGYSILDVQRPDAAILKTP